MRTGAPANVPIGVTGVTMEGRRRTARSAADIVCWSREAPPHSPASSFGLVLPALRDERAADVQAAIFLAQCCHDGVATFMANAVG